MLTQGGAEAACPGLRNVALSGLKAIAFLSPPSMFCIGPEAQLAKELCEGGGLVVGVEAAGVGEDPGVAAAEGVLLQADAGVLDAGDDAVRTDTDEGDDRGPPAFHFGFEALAAGTKLVVCQFIGTGGGAFDDVGDAELEVEQSITLKGREESRREATGVEGGPEAVAGAAEVTADGGGVKAGVDAGEEDDEVLGDEIRDALRGRGEQLSLSGFPRCGNCPFHKFDSILSAWPKQFLYSLAPRCQLDARRRATGGVMMVKSLFIGFRRPSGDLSWERTRVLCVHADSTETAPCGGSP